MLGRTFRQQGDTLIEVLFAVTVFSLVAVGGLAIMNQGTATSQRALEISLVRQEIDGQAEALRFLHNSYVSVYQDDSTYPADTPAGQWALMLDSIIETDSASASDFGAVGLCPTPPAGSFIINTRSATFVDPSEGKISPSEVFSKVEYESIGDQSVVRAAEGIWIEAVRSDPTGDVNQANAGFIDFHIRACWDSAGQSEPVTLGTIVRLYEPRG